MDTNCHVTGLQTSKGPWKEQLISFGTGVLKGQLNQIWTSLNQLKKIMFLIFSKKHI